MKHIDIQVSNVLYGGQEILKKRGNVLISFFLEGLLLEGKFMLLLKFIFLLFRCVFEAMFMVKFNLGFHKYADEGPILDVPVRWCADSFQRNISIFGTPAQHATREEEEAIYYPYKLCNNNVIYLYKYHEIICEMFICSGFIDNYFIWSRHGETQPRTESIIDEREEETVNVPDHVYSPHDDGGEDDVSENDEGLDMEELTRNVAPDVLL
jgi:hypothetical protein